MTEPHYADNSTTVYAGDCLEILPTLPDNSVDAVVTDPPYGLEFMGKDWDRFRPEEYRGGRWDGRGLTVTSGDTTRQGADEMADRLKALPSLTYKANQKCRACGKWQRDKPHRKCVCTAPNFEPRVNDRNHGYQAWCQAWAAECLRILKPGGHLLAFGGTRTAHRLTCAIEDAGFEIRDSIAFMYGAGFPKSLAVGRAIDGKLCRDAGTHSDDLEHICPATPEGEPWRGHGTALKPGHEPVIVARKPLSGTVAANVLAWGTGALNIDAARIAHTEPPGRSTVAQGGRSGGIMGNHSERHYETTAASTAGRWPANVVLDESQAAALDQQSGDTASLGGSRGAVGQHGAYSSIPAQPDVAPGYGDIGGASRFFYTAKASTDERITHNGVAHPTVKPLDLMRWLIRLHTPPGGLLLEPFAGSGTTAEAAILENMRCIAIEREPDYLPLIVQRINRRRDPIAYIRHAGEDLGLFGD